MSPNRSPQIPFWATRTTSPSSSMLKHAASIPPCPVSTKRSQVVEGVACSQGLLWGKSNQISKVEPNLTLQNKRRQISHKQTAKACCWKVRLFFFVNLAKRRNSQQGQIWVQTHLQTLFLTHSAKLTCSWQSKSDFVCCLECILDTFFNFVQNLRNKENLVSFGFASLYALMEATADVNTRVGYLCEIRGLTQ